MYVVMWRLAVYLRKKIGRKMSSTALCSYYEHSTGAGLFSILEPLKERVVIVISADLAHTHLASGPYGYSNASEPFDQVSTK